MQLTASSTSSSIDEQSQRVVRLLSPRSPGVSTEFLAEEPTRDAINVDWQGRRVEPVLLELTEVVFAEPHAPPPGYVHDFARLVSKIRNVRRVIAEPGEDGASVHITTFAEHLSDDVRAEIYKLEADFILGHPGVMFDFHLRREEDVSGTPALVTAKYYYAIWAYPNANSRPTSPTSR